MKKTLESSQNSLYQSDVKHIEKNLSDFLRAKKHESLNAGNRNLNKKTD